MKTGHLLMPKPKQLVTFSEWESYKHVMSSYGFRIDSEGFPFIPLFYSKISIFYGGNKNEDPPIKKDEPNGIYPFGITCTTVVVMPPKNEDLTRVFCVIDVIEKKEKYCDKENYCEPLYIAKMNFFNKNKIPYFIFDKNQFENIKDKKEPIYFNKFEPSSSIILGSKDSYGSLNYYQYESASSFFVKNISEKGEMFGIICEPRLNMIMTVGSDKKLIEEINLEIKNPKYCVGIGYFRSTSVDAVICVDMPYGIPLFAIEYDGKTHDELDKINKDRAKNLIFCKSGIPLLRVKSKHLTPKDENWSLKTNINREIAKQILEIMLNEKHYVSMMLRFLKEEAYNIKKSKAISSSSNILRLVEKLDLFLNRRYTEIDKLKNERDFYQKEFDRMYSEFYDYLPEENQQYNIKITILTKKKLDGITVEATLQVDEAYKAVGGKRTSFIAGPYMVEDGSGFFKFDKLIESMLRKDIERQLDDHFKSGNPSLEEKMYYYRISKRWKIFEEKHNSRVRWWLQDRFYKSLVNKYNSLCCVHHYIDIEPPYIEPPLKLLEIYLKQLDHPCLDVPDEEKKQVIRDLVGLKELLSDEKTQLLFQIIKQGGFEDSRDFVNAFVCELLNSTDKFSIFDAIQDKYTIISIVENAKTKAIQKMMDFQLNQYKRKDTYALNKAQKQLQPEIEKINSIVKKIKEIFVL